MTGEAQIVTVDTGESTKGIHRISALMSCPRLFGYRYLLNLTTAVEKQATGLGTCCHVGIDAHFRGTDWRAALLSVPSRIAPYAGMALPLVEQYVRKWGSSEQEYVYSLEKEYQLSLCGTEGYITRKLDRVMLRDGVVSIYDVKTAGRVQERVKKTKLDPTLFTQEMVGRWVLAPQVGARWGGLYLDLVPTGTGNFLRHRLVYPQESLARWEESLLGWVMEETEIVKRFENGELDPWKLRQSFQCYPQGYYCDYQDLCTDGPSALGRFVRK